MSELLFTFWWRNKYFLHLVFVLSAKIDSNESILVLDSPSVIIFQSPNCSDLSVSGQTKHKMLMLSRLIYIYFIIAILWPNIAIYHFVCTCLGVAKYGRVQVPGSSDCAFWWPHIFLPVGNLFHVSLWHLMRFCYILILIYSLTVGWIWRFSIRELDIKGSGLGSLLSRYLLEIVCF